MKTRDKDFSEAIQNSRTIDEFGVDHDGNPIDKKSHPELFVPQDKEVEELDATNLVHRILLDVYFSDINTGKEKAVLSAEKLLDHHYRKKFADELLERLPEEKDTGFGREDHGNNVLLTEVKQLIKEVRNENSN